MKINKINFEEAIKNKGITQRKLATLIVPVMDPHELSNIKTGIRNPKYEKVLGIANALDCSVEYLTAQS